MKKYIVILSILSKMVVAQNLSFDEILKLQTKEFEYVEEFLTARNWQFISSELPTDDKLGIVTFRYGKDQFSDKARSFIHYIYSAFKKRVSIHISSKLKYSEFLTRAKALGFKPYNTMLDENQITKVYLKGNIVARFSTQVTEGDYNDTKTYYNVMIMTFNDCISSYPELIKYSDK